MRNSIGYTNMDAKAAAGIGSNIFVKDFNELVASIDAVVGGGEAVTIKCQGSIADDAPTFSSAQSASNQWDYVEVVDIQSGTAIDGDTGIAISGANENVQVVVNTSGLNWINFILSSITGTITVTVKVQIYD